MRRLPAALLLALALRPAPARACSCLGPGHTRFLAPADGARDVPTNARLWLGVGELESPPGARAPPLLLDPADAGVPLDGSRLQGAGGEEVEVFTPREPLRPGQPYRLVLAGRTTTFTTGAGPDTTGPAKPVLQETTRHTTGFLPIHLSSCGPSHRVAFTVTSEGVLTVLDQEHQATLSAAPPGGRVAALGVFGPELGLGLGPCSSNWPKAGPGAHTTARFGAFDLAGNFSGWSEEEGATIPPTPLGCDCTAADASAGWPLLPALLALLGRARKRKPPVG